MTNTNKKSTNKCWRECREKGIVIYYWWESKLVQPLWRTVWKFLRKLKIVLPYDPAIPLLGVYPKKKKKKKQLNSKRYTHLYVHSSTTYNSQDMETF